MTDILTPGSLPARVLAHMLTTRTESAPDELAAELDADPGEVRQSLGTLRRLGKVLQRLEDHKAVYRLPDAAHMRIAGSALQAIPSPLELRRDTKTARREPPAAEPITPKEPPMTDKPPVKPGTDRAKILALITAEPGISNELIAERMGIALAKAQAQVQQLQHKKLIQKASATKPYTWKAAGVAHVSTPKPENKPRAAPRIAKPAAKPKNLAALGAPTKAPSKAAKPVRLGSAIENPALAIDADGIVAIEDVKLSPKGIQSLVAFLEKTQHVWQRLGA